MSVSDAEKNKSCEMNKVSGNINVRDGDDIRIVFIGNSITLHAPLASIGWYSQWGMAASSAEKDYVHLVIRGIEAETGRRANVQIRNLQDFERNYETYNLNELQDLADFKPDYLIVSLGENVKNLDTPDDCRKYEKAFKALLEKFMVGRMQPHAVVRGCFWQNIKKDELMEHAASDFSIPFVKADISEDESMKAIGKFEHLGVQNHPGDKGMAKIAELILNQLFPKKSGYEVWVNDAPVNVRPIRVSAMPFNQWAAEYQRPLNQTEIAGMLKFEMEENTDIRVKPDRPFENVKIRPLSAGIRPRIFRNEVLFTIQNPGYYVLELDGYHCPLEIFADQKRDFSKEKAESNIVFGPGIHNPVTVILHSHDRVYIDKDACVYGSFQADNVEDVKVSGYGIIHGARNRRVGNNCYRDGMDGAVRITDSKNIVFDGPVVLDSACWCVAAFNSSNLEFAHLKVTEAWRYNTDGIDICNSQHVHIHDCFVHSFDDTIVMKGNFPERDRQDPEEDILVERCICWCGWGRTLETGLETFAPYFRGITFRDCDLIHNNHAALSVHLGGPAIVSDVTYNNIRIEYDASEMSPVLQTDRDQKAECHSSWMGVWLSITNDKMFGSGFFSNLGYDSTNDSFGTIKQVKVEDITIITDENLPAPQTLIYANPGSEFGEIELDEIRFFTEKSFWKKTDPKQ